MKRRERVLRGARNRLLQLLALYAPGASTVRVWLHRKRGVRIGEKVFIGTDALIETSRPYLVEIGNGVGIGIRSVIIAHFHGGTKDDRRDGTLQPTVRIEDNVHMGPGCIVMPNVTIGYGAVIAAGSVVTRSVPALTMVQGNPAKPVARCGSPLTGDVSLKEFYRQLRPL